MRYEHSMSSIELPRTSRAWRKRDRSAKVDNGYIAQFPRKSVDQSDVVAWSYISLQDRTERSRSVVPSRTNNSAISPRCDGDCATMLKMPPRYGYAQKWHEDLITMLLRFCCASSSRRYRYVNFEQVKPIGVWWRLRFYYDLSASTALLLRLQFMSIWPKFRILAESRPVEWGFNKRLNIYEEKKFHTQFIWAWTFLITYGPSYQWA